MARSRTPEAWQRPGARPDKSGSAIDDGREVTRFLVRGLPRQEEQASRPSAVRSATYRDIAPRNVTPDEPRSDFGRLTTSTQRRDVTGRMAISGLLLAIDIAVLVMTLEHVRGPARFCGGLVLGLVLPGWSIIGLLHLRRIPLEFGLTIATSLALFTVVAQLLITFHSWELTTVEVVACAVCAPSLAWQVVRTFTQAGGAKWRA
jgi:hypothetical protein